MSVQEITIPAEVAELTQWLQNKAHELKIDARMYPERARLDREWIYLPVCVAGEKGAFERAERLQDLEDSWENAHEGSGRHILLVPTAD